MNLDLIMNQNKQSILNILIKIDLSKEKIINLLMSIHLMNSIANKSTNTSHILNKGIKYLKLNHNQEILFSLNIHIISVKLLINNVNMSQGKNSNIFHVNLTKDYKILIITNKKILKIIISKIIIMEILLNNRQLNIILLEILSKDTLEILKEFMTEIARTNFNKIYQEIFKKILIGKNII